MIDLKNVKAELKTINQKNIFNDPLCITVENADSEIENEIDADVNVSMSASSININKDQNKVLRIHHRSGHLNM